MAEKAPYFKSLSSGSLSVTTIKKIRDHLEKQGLRIKPIPSEIMKENAHQKKITDYLTRLNLSVVEGNPSWEGLFIEFRGNRYELSTRSVGTPYLRMILYPILDLHHRLQEIYPGKRLPCIYFVGERFSDVILRKFELLNDIIPNIIVLTHDIYECALNKTKLPKTEKTSDNESWTQMKLCELMNFDNGLLLPTKTTSIRARFLSYEIPCNEGTENPERLDILGYDEDNHSLIAFELKGCSTNRVELENLFLQGLEHRNWLERNKMAVKLLFDDGPHGRRINTRKRVRLLLGFYGNTVPHLFLEMRDQVESRDPYAEIDFIRLSNTNDTVSVSRFENDSPN